MHFRHVIAASSLALALPLAPALAQDVPAPEPPKWSLALGVDPTHLNLQSRDGGIDARFVANLTRSWQSAHSSWGRHVSLMVGSDAPTSFSTEPDNPQCNCSMNVSRHYAALTAGLSYDLPRLSRFTPYLKGGTGLYYEHFKSVPASGFITSGQLPLLTDRRELSFGANAGFGVKARFGSHEFFVEQMLHAFNVRHLNRGVYPLNIGFRF